ncbi:LysR family transcriptional regulator [Acidovorax sp. DW039]|uniref:LysR family transcriptional regulator n=1 Tax=Acidovorax sp. DW039 TaxID=3095606 RepID=UPI00308ADC1F|nr:LysR family transcriptional regulator [Acidovorax sp. DW039]
MPSINYRLDDLRALLALHGSGSFVRAAEQLHITQPAFSRRIAQLEAALGGALVERTTRKVAMTTLGLDLVRNAGPLLEQLDETLAETARCARGESGRLSVACLTTVAYALLPPIMRAFQQRYPQLRLHLRDDTGQRVVQAVLQREAEFGVGVLNNLPPDIISQHCADDPYVIAFAPGHPLERMRKVPWRTLSAHRVVALRSTSANRQQIDAALTEAGVTPPWFDEVEHLSSMLGLLRGGVGIGVLPRWALHSADATELRTRPLVEPAIVRPIGLLRRRDALLSQPAQVLWQLLQVQLAPGAPAKTQSALTTAQSAGNGLLPLQRRASRTRQATSSRAQRKTP